MNCYYGPGVSSVVKRVGTSQDRRFNELFNPIPFAEPKKEKTALVRDYEDQRSANFFKFLGENDCPVRSDCKLPHKVRKKVNVAGHIIV